MGLAGIDLIMLTLMMLNLTIMILKLLIMLDLWVNRYKQPNACIKEISNELMPVAWYPRR